jgi:hypothetical protein
MRGWIKEEERHRATISRIDQLLDDLGEAPEEQLLATNTHICGSEAKSFHARKLKPGRETRSAAKGGRSEPAKP